MKKSLIFSLIILVLCTGCATKQSAYYNKINSLVSQRNFSEAATYADKEKHKAYGEKNALLYYLDRGFLLHCAGDYTGSNEAFEKAKTLSREYFTKSVTAEASTLLINDAAKPYYGEDFEQALVNTFCALNYFFLGKETEALVEARQVDHLLKTIQTNYPKTKYKEDPFSRYLMGMLYENQKDINNAYISYYQAIKGYQELDASFQTTAPRELVLDALRCAKKLGFRDDIIELQKKFAVTEAPAIPAGYGEIVLLHYNGISPVKTDTFFEISFGEAWGYVGYVQPQTDEQKDFEQAASIARSILAEEQVRIAFPKYIQSPYRINASRIEVSTASQKDSAIVDNIGAYAIQSLDERIARIRIRAIARAAIKYSLAKKTSDVVQQQTQNDLLGWVAKKTLSVAANATETADKRSWRTLPDQIRMARVALPEGNYSIHFSGLDEHGSVISASTCENIRVSPGKKSLVIVRTTG